MKIDYSNARNGAPMAEKNDFYRRQFLGILQAFGGLEPDNDRLLATESSAFGG
jgi:hypothetical protein